MEYKYKIALVIKTEGLEYDDRVRKEILSVKKLFPEIEFKIFAMLDKNIEIEGITSYGIPYKGIYIPARDKYSSGKMPLLKAWQFHRAIEHELLLFDAVWAANDTVPFTLLLTKNKRLLWDEHELPKSFLGGLFKQAILKYIYRRCKVVVHANPQRRQYLINRGLIENPNKHYALRNYPSFSDLVSEFGD